MRHILFGAECEFRTEANFFGAFVRQSIPKLSILELRNGISPKPKIMPSESASEAAIAARYPSLVVTFKTYA